jgi:hypothetical protein
MSETSANYLTKGEFRFTAIALALLLVVATYLIRNAIPACLGPNGGKGKDSPILVQGGSMTAFTVTPGAASGWGPPSGPPSNPTYCINVDTSYIQFEDGINSYPPLSSLNPTWEVDIYGHDVTDTTGHKQTINGLKLIAAPQKCPGTTSPLTTSVSASAIGGTFYLSPLPTTSKYTGNLRFLDNTHDCGSDEDFCERMALVRVKSNAGVVLGEFPCVDGECSVSIGTPQ